MSKQKYLTDEERQISSDRQKQRVKITNTVKRYNIDNSCCLCRKAWKDNS